MDAHKLSAQCQLAATVVSDETYALMSKRFVEGRVFDSMFKDAIIEHDPTGINQLSSSLVGNTSKKMKTLCWFFLEMGRMEPFVVPADLDTFVQTKFMAHGTQLSGEKEQMKAFNTITLFKAWKATAKPYRQQVVLLRPPNNWQKQR